MFRAASVPITRSYLLYNLHCHILCRMEHSDPASKRSSNLHKMCHCRLYSR